MGKTSPLLPATAALLFLSACAVDPVSSVTASNMRPGAASVSSNSGLNLHPDGFGQASYAAWKAHQGLQDTRGNADQALYFQKMTATATFAAGVARITGLEGQPISNIAGLQWERRDIGWCGAGAPRWDIFVTGPDGFRTTIFLGCLAAEHTPDPLNPGWTFDTFPGLGAAVTAGLPKDADPANFTISGLSIVFDEGNDLPFPFAGFVFLDNITVNSQTWTSPADNGGN